MPLTAGYARPLTLRIANARHRAQHRVPTLHRRVPEPHAAPMLAVTAMFSAPCSTGLALIALRKQPVHGTGRDSEAILGTRISGPQCAGGYASLWARILAAETLAPSSVRCLRPLVRPPRQHQAPCETASSFAAEEATQRARSSQSDAKHRRRARCRRESTHGTV